MIQHRAPRTLHDRIASFILVTSSLLITAIFILELLSLIIDTVTK